MTARRLGFTSLVLPFALVLVAACNRTAEPRQAASVSKSEAASLERLANCAQALEEIFATPAKERASALLEHGQELRACTLVVAGCGAETESMARELAAREGAEALRSACLDAYCDRLDPRPALCEGSDHAELTPAEILAITSEFIAAKLASDLELPRDDPRLVRAADAMAPLWAAADLIEKVEVSSPERPPPLALTVTIDARGYTVDGEGIEPRLIPATERPGLYPSFDQRALADYARELGRRFPHESSVSISASSDVPMAVIVAAIEALAGSDCRAAEGELEGCLFFETTIL